jgi:ATP-dependent helicase/DNAse subunit B
VALTLITGPANAGKAELVFTGLRADLARGGAPWLVVPSAADARHYRQELAAGGVVLGVRVAQFRDLCEELARRARIAGGPIDELARERILHALRTTPERAVRARGYVRELARFVSELERVHVTPRRLHTALDAWQRSEPGAARDALAAAALYERYAAALCEMGRVDTDLRSARALDALRETPARWHTPGAPATAVFFYGFDDLTALQLDTVETLARVVDAPVTVALAFEPGRIAFAEPAATFQTLLPLAREHIAVPAASRYYAPAARGALGHLERRLFEPGGGEGDDARVGPADAIRLLEGGGERAELELVAAEIKALLDGGMQPREIALVHREPESIASTLAEVLDAEGVPFSLTRASRFAQTALGRGLTALLRCALASGDQHDLLAWLRTPGVIERAELVDDFERQVQRAGARSAAQARRLWEQQRWPLSTLDRLRAAAARGAPALIDCVEKELWRLFCNPHHGAAPELDAPERDEAAAFRAATAALAALRELVEQSSGPPLLADPAELVELLEELRIEPQSVGASDAVPVLRPLELRARRVRALFLCGLQERVFPAAAKSPPLLSEQERRSLAEVSGLSLERPRDWLARERYLLYACVSRPEELLVLSWHSTDDDGNATARSLFVDDVCDLFDERLFEARSRRPLGALAALAAPAQRDRGVEEADLFGGLSDARVLDELGAGRPWSASALTTFARCPVRWFVEQLLRPEQIEPDGEPLACGRAIHAVLKDVLDSLRKELGSARIVPEHLSRARALAAEAIERACSEAPLSPLPEQSAGLRRRLASDVDRYLEHAARAGGSLEPSHLELSFGLGGEGTENDLEHARALPELDLGEGLRVRGRIDRIDVGQQGEAVVYDYKRRGGASAPPGEKWVEEGSFQVALYMRAARDLLGLRPVGGFYQPVTGEDLRARGALAAGVDAPCMKSDRREQSELDALVEETLSRVRDAASRASAGKLEPRPRTCSATGQGCMYPTICRCER